MLRGHSKQLILRNCYKLKGDGTIGIDNEMLKEEQADQKKHLNLAKANSLKAKLIIGNKF